MIPGGISIYRKVNDMTVQMTIIGLGRIGASLGLAMAEQGKDLLRIGNDIQPSVLRRAKEINAVDEVCENLAASVKEADIVILALPVHQLRQTLDVIADELKEHVVLLDTSPCKEAVAGWMKGIMAHRCSYAGIYPAINPRYLQEAERGIESAHADLFQKGLMAIAAPPEMAGEAIQLAADLAEMVGAVPFFSSPGEVDGILSATHLMPQLTSTALANSITESAGRIDRQKLTGHSFTASTSLLGYEESPELAQSAYLGRENTVCCIDHLIEELEALRKMLLADDSGELDEYLGRVQKNHAKWRQGRWGGNSISEEAGGMEFPRKGDAIRHMFIGVRAGKKK